MNHKHPNICYFCGMPLDKTTITREHVPPKCFFPKGQKVDLITMPSCKEHNGGKSGDDEYLWQMISINILANEEGHKIATEKSVRSILNKSKLKKELAENAQTIYVKDLRNNGEFKKTFAFPVNSERVENAISSITKALYFHEFKKVFFGKLTIHDESTFFINGSISEKNK